MEVPGSFPDFKALGHYRDPAISTADQMHDLRGLRQGWDRPVDQRKLRNLLRDRFNMWTRGFLKHIAPIYLARALARATPEQRDENVRYGVVLKRTRKAKAVDGEEPPAKAERKILFAPLPLVDINGSQRPLEEEWSIWDSKDGKPYDPVEPIECEILDCFLRNGLPEGAIVVAPTPTRKKRKADSELEGCVSDDTTTAPSQPSDQPQELGSAPESQPKKPARAKKAVENGEASRPARKKAKKSNEVELAEGPPPPVFKLPSSGLAPNRPPKPFHPTSSASSTVVVDLGISDDDAEPKIHHAKLSGQSSKIMVRPNQHSRTTAVSTDARCLDVHIDPSQVKPPKAPTPGKAHPAAGPKLLAPPATAPKSGKTTAETALVPGEVIKPAALRQLRALAFTKHISIESTVLAPRPSKTSHEVIDLT